MNNVERYKRNVSIIVIMMCMSTFLIPLDVITLQQHICFVMVMVVFIFREVYRAFKK